MRWTNLLVLLFLSAILSACPTSRGDDDDVTDDDDSGDDDDATDDDDAVPDEETDCDDGIDEDQDELTDCDDPDCADVAPCWWPSGIDHTGDFNFQGAEIECEVAGIPFDFDVPDCRTTYTSPQYTEVTDGCATCDITYDGAFTYSEDGCGDLLETTSPASGSFGFVFLSATEWEVYAQNEDTGAWDSVGIAEDDGAGNHIISAADVVSGNPEECEVDDDQDLGTLTVTLTFSDAAQ